MKKLRSILLAVAMLMAFAIPAIATETATEQATETATDAACDIQILSDIVVDERVHDEDGFYFWHDHGKFDAIVAGKEFMRITLSELENIVDEVYGDCDIWSSDNQSETSWTVDNTYKCTLEFQRKAEGTGESVTFLTLSVNVSVQNIIESITAEPIIIYEGGFEKTSGYTATVTFKDGTTDEAYVYLSGDEWPTEVGTYQATCYVYRTVAFPVTIQVVPFDADIQITSDVIIDEKIHDADGHYLWTAYGKLNATVAGKEYKGITPMELESAVRKAYGNCSISCADDQFSNPWTVGNTHEVYIWFYQFSEETGERSLLFAAPINVSVQNFIESISVEPITIYGGGYGANNEYSAVIAYKDGSSEEVTLYRNWEWPTEVGTYTKTAYVYGYIEVPVTINVVPFPADIQITSDIVIDEKIHFEDGYCAWHFYGKMNAVVAGQEFKGITLPELEQAVSEAYGDCDIDWSHDGSVDWTVGNTCVCSIEIRHWSEEADDYMLLFASDVNIVVQETNIESVAAEPVTIYEGGVDPELAYPAVVTYKDGNTGEAPMYFSAEELPTKVGTYEVTGYVYKCIETPVTVYVVARPDSGQDEITVEDGVATVPDSAVEVTEGEDVVIDVTGTEEKAGSVVLGAETVDKIADAEAPVEVKLPAASVSFDKTAIGSINEQAGESPVTIVAQKVAESTLNAQQTAALEKAEVCAVLTVEAFAGETKITNFGGGKVTISIPFELPEGKEGKDFYVAYVADDGTVTAMPTTYADGKLTFETTHFSSYVVLEDATVNPPTNDATEPTDGTTPSTGDNPQTGDNSHLMLIAVLMVVSAAALAVCATKRRAF